MSNRSCGLYTNNLSYSYPGTNEGPVNSSVPGTLNISNTAGFPFVGVTGLYFSGESGSFGSGNATALQQGALFSMQGIGYPTYTDTGLSVMKSGTVQRIGGNILSGGEYIGNKYLRYFNGTTYEVPFLSPESINTSSSTSINLSSIVGNTTGYLSGTGAPYPYGNLTITIGTGLSVSAGNTIYVTYDVNDYMWGTVVSYNSSSGSTVVNIIYAIGSGSYSSWSVLVAPIGAGSVRISKGGVVYCLPQTSLVQQVDAAGYTGYSSGLPATYNNNGGTGGVGVSITSLFARPYTITSINYAFFLQAYSYGDNGRSGQCSSTLYYSTAPVGNSPSWVSIASGSVSYGS